MRYCRKRISLYNILRKGGMKMDTIRKKQRGQDRKLKRMFHDIDKFQPDWIDNERYEHFHVPSDPFIESEKTTNQNKKAFYEKWLATVERLMKEKPQDIAFCKIVGMISVPDLWCSEIIIFYDRKYYSSFFKRDSSYQTWIKIKNDSFLERKQIQTPLKEIGYQQIIRDEDIYQNELWFYGDVK